MDTDGLYPTVEPVEEMIQINSPTLLDYLIPVPIVVVIFLVVDYFLNRTLYRSIAAHDMLVWSDLVILYSELYLIYEDYDRTFPEFEETAGVKRIEMQMIVNQSKKRYELARTLHEKKRIHAVHFTKYIIGIKKTTPDIYKKSGTN